MSSPCKEALFPSPEVVIFEYFFHFTTFELVAFQNPLVKVKVQYLDLYPR